MWLDFRNFTSESPLVDMGDFVMVNADLHDDFDEFKKSEVKPLCSFVPLTELLKLYCLSQDAPRHPQSKEIWKGVYGI